MVFEEPRARTNAATNRRFSSTQRLWKFETTWKIIIMKTWSHTLGLFFSLVILFCGKDQKMNEIVSLRLISFSFAQTAFWAINSTNNSSKKVERREARNKNETTSHISLAFRCWRIVSRIITSRNIITFSLCVFHLKDDRFS